VTKVVINKCYGGFGLSDEAATRLGRPLSSGLSGHNSARDMQRDDPQLVALVEELGTDRVSGKLAELHVVEVPDGVEWRIEEYDGQEWVAETHRTWE
jgi:hypothetical protein